MDQAKQIVGFDPLLTNYMERTLPTWFYYRNFKAKKTMIDSPEIMPFFQALAAPSSQTIKGVSGDLVVATSFSTI